MDDQSKKNPYDDFFSGAGSDKDGSEPERGSEERRPSYYYSYGPFKSSRPEQGASAASDDGQPQAQARRDGYAAPMPQDRVEVTPPRPIAAYGGGGGGPSRPTNGWQVREKRRTSLRAIFASFMAGVLVVGGLMFASDRLNWFTSGEALAPQQSESESEETAAMTAAQGGGGTVSNTLDVVRPNNIAEVFEKSSPAVVKIETFAQARGGGRSGDSLWNDPFFRQFFGDELTPSQPNGNGQLTPSGLGSGFFFDKEGYILTNQHVVEGADQIKVTVQGYDEPLEAELLGSDFNLDLAVLKVSGDKDFPVLPLGDSNAINIGEWVVAIGNPNGFDHTVTVGVLSAKERPITIPDQNGTRNYEHLLQTDASINPGNSGGPLLNLSGEVVGINTAVSTQAQGIGFAIPTSTIKEVVETLKNNEKIPVPFIGATLTNITQEIASQLGLNDTKGSVVYNITYNSPAFQADLRQYDVVVGMDGTKYDNKEDLIAAIQKKKVGDKVTLNVIRSGKQLDLEVTIGDRNNFNVE